MSSFVDLSRPTYPSNFLPFLSLFYWFVAIRLSDYFYSELAEILVLRFPKKQQILQRNVWKGSTVFRSLCIYYV